MMDGKLWMEITNLRIMAQNTAVHSDMFIWRKEERVEDAALQILNILYSVPQLSVRLGEVVFRSEVDLDQGVYEFEVPPSGMLSLDSSN